MREFITMGYTYDELTPYAREMVKQWYIERYSDSFDDSFYQETMEELHTLFPRSDLKVQYSLSCSQGDGLNIYGTLDLLDFLDKWEHPDKDKRTIAFYINHGIYRYEFEYNDRYCYSCKFIDRKDIPASVDEWVDELTNQGMRGIDHGLIERFYTDMIDYFEALERRFENRGYEWFEVSDDEVAEVCASNEFHFTCDGEYIC